MTRRRARTPLALVGTLAVASSFLAAIGAPAGGAAGVAPQAAGTAKGTVGVFVDTTDGLARGAVRAAGSALVADYGTFALYRVPAAAAERAIAAGATPAGDLDHLSLRGRVIDTATGSEPSLPANLRTARAGAKALALVQFAGPVKAAWLDELSAAGLTPVAPVPPNGYVVHGSAKAVAALPGLATANAAIAFTGPFRPGYRIAPDLEGKAATRNGDGSVDVTVQVVAGETSDVAAVAASGQVLAAPETVAGVGLTNVSVRVPASAIDDLAGLPSVVNVEPRIVPVRNDEAQGQILARNIAQVGGKWGPTGPGYLAFLTGKNVSTNAADHPIVAVVDDGVDNGTATPLHPDFYVSGIKAGGTSRIMSSFDCTGGGNPHGVDGHGNINAGIVGGFNNGTGFPKEDAAGYNFGLGVDPYARLANIKIFADGGSFKLSDCGGTYGGIGTREVAAGAKISSNSWGSNAGGAYDVSAQAYDALTRDAAANLNGLQPMFYVFSAGNSGPGPNTIGAPGTAKNVLTVGATENVRDQGTSDGCSISAADNADDMATFSSRGPTDDNRAKPDVVAPGTHVQGPASQDPAYNGTGVCGPKFYPAAQSLYTWSSGTSHSAPAASGAAALAWEYYRRVVTPGVNPSPAMLKAILLNTPRYLAGNDTGGTLPGTGQGWGDIDLASMMTPGRYALDQSTTFTASGQELTKYFTVASSAAPTRITLAFTDAVGSTVGNAYVNDLDLLVVADGRVYRGNVFDQQWSTTGGTNDARNNVEQVFLPAGITGPVVVKVVARNIAGNGVPGGTALDQDFALTAVNLTESVTPPAVVPYFTGAVTASDAGTGGNNNGAVEPGEIVRMSYGVGNAGAGAAPAGSVATSVAGGTLADIIASNAAAPALAAGAEGTASGAMVRYRVGAACGGSFSLLLKYTASGKTAKATFAVRSGAGGAPVTVSSADVPKAIPDNNATGASSTLASAQSGPLRSVSLSATHTFDADLVFKLIAPTGQSVVLINRRGANGDNFTNTVLRDDAATSVAAGAAPFSGAFRPEQPLSTFTGSSAGVWTLNVVDNASADTGSLAAWSASFSTCAAAPVGLAVNNAPAVAEGTGVGTTAATFTVLRSGPLTNAITFTVSTADGTAVAAGDYTALAGQSVTIPAGAAQVTIPVSVVRDAVVEPKETFALKIATVPPGVQKVRGTGTATITNDD